MKDNKKNMGLMLLGLMSVIGCSKSVSSGNTVGTGGTYPATTDSVYSPVDPTVATSIGFFQNNWTARTFTSPDTVSGAVPSGAATDSLTINVNKVVTKVSKYVFGNNSELWTGQLVTQPNLMQYIKDLSPNIIRGPG